MRGTVHRVDYTTVRCPVPDLSSPLATEEETMRTVLKVVRVPVYPHTERAETVAEATVVKPQVRV